MKNSWMFGGSMIVFLGGLLFGAVVQGQDEPKVQTGDAANGKTLFIKHCTGCHGPEGGGGGYKFIKGPDPANLTSPSTRKKSDADLLKAIHDGKPNMPPWQIRLSDSESRDLLAYVRTLAK